MPVKVKSIILCTDSLLYVIFNEAEISLPARGGDNQIQIEDCAIGQLESCRCISFNGGPMKLDRITSRQLVKHSSWHHRRFAKCSNLNRVLRNQTDTCPKPREVVPISWTVKRTYHLNRYSPPFCPAKRLPWRDNSLKAYPSRGGACVRSKPGIRAKGCLLFADS